MAPVVTHRHKCIKCGHVWEHGPESAESIDAHRHCGSLWPYHFEDESEFEYLMLTMMALADLLRAGVISLGPKNAAVK